MWLKVVIVLLFIGNILALGRAFYTLVVDQGQAGKRTTTGLKRIDGSNTFSALA